MKTGNLSSKVFLILIFFCFSPLFAEEQVNLENIQPTFEEELENLGENETEDTNYIRLKKKTKNYTTQKIVNLKALDKITAKTLDINIVLGEKKKIWLFRNITQKLQTIYKYRRYRGSCLLTSKRFIRQKR